MVRQAEGSCLLPKFSDMLTLSQSGGADYAQPLALPHLDVFRDYAPGVKFYQKILEHTWFMSMICLPSMFKTFSKMLMRDLFSWQP